MPARVFETGVIYDMPVNTFLLSPSPPGLGHYFPVANRPKSVGYYPTLSSPGSFNMGLGHRGDLLMQLQRDRRELPLRSCIKVKSHSINGVIGFGLSAISSGRKLSSVDIIPESGLRTTQSSPELYQMNGSKLKETGDGKEKKRVSFADAKGYSLHTVKYMDGPSNMPPKLRIHLLQDVIQNVEAKPTHPYMYVPAFEQPASNYLQFRDRLDKELVCLENVLLKDNITVVGTVKVKNISFEKSVVVRATFDDWKTHRDITGSYVFPTQASNSHDKYDTFSFELDILPNQGGKSFEFCICYKVNEKSLWDNNRGNNYKIITEREKDCEQHKEQTSYHNLSGGHSYGQFSYWQVESNEERPYW